MDNFTRKWLGKRVNPDGVYGYQCVDLIKQYLREGFGIKAGWWGNAIDYWRYTNPAILKRFDKLQTSSAKKGDIVVLRGISGNPYGHIGIATGAINNHAVEILEQNGSTGNGLGQGGDKIRRRFVGRQRVAGVLRPKAKRAPVFLLVHKGKGLADLARRAGYRLWFMPPAWKKIAGLNGRSNWRSYNASLKPNQRVRVK